MWADQKPEGQPWHVGLGATEGGSGGCGSSEGAGASQWCTRTTHGMSSVCCKCVSKIIRDESLCRRQVKGCSGCIVLSNVKMSNLKLEFRRSSLYQVFHSYRLAVWVKAKKRWNQSKRRIHHQVAPAASRVIPTNHTSPVCPHRWPHPNSQARQNLNTDEGTAFASQCSQRESHIIWVEYKMTN